MVCSAFEALDIFLFGMIGHILCMQRDSYNFISFDKNEQNPDDTVPLSPLAYECIQLYAHQCGKKKKKTFRLTNRPDFFMVCTLIDQRNDAIKCSKLKWDHEPQASGFTAKF